MTVQLSARFDSRDAADLAVARLRRSGIIFDIADISKISGDLPSDSGFPGSMVNIVYPYSLINSMDTLPGYVYGGQRFGARALVASDGSRINPDFDKGDAILKIDVHDYQLESARSILRSAHGYSIHTFS